MHLVPLQRPVTGDCAMRGTCYFQDERRGRRLKSADPRICRYVAENEAVRALPFKEGRCVTRPSGLDRGQATSRGGAHRSESWRLQGSVNDIRRGKSYINPRPSERPYTGDCFQRLRSTVRCAITSATVTGTRASRDEAWNAGQRRTSSAGPCGVLLREVRDLADGGVRH